MAIRGTPIPAQTIKQIHRLREVLSQRKTAREAEVCRATVQKYQKKKG